MIREIYLYNPLVILTCKHLYLMPNIIMHLLIFRLNLLNKQDDNVFVPTDPNPKPDKPDVKPPKSGGGRGTFGDSDLLDVSGGDYKPDGGRSGGGMCVFCPPEAGPGQIAGIVSAIGVALVGAASSYFAYQKKKLCFKLQGGADPESGKGQHGTHSDPQGKFLWLLK
uniref:CD99 molecule n=1 Tax=Monopterus albus TaxID=43700 RepID=A0A3Q3J8L0_MONAL